MKKSKEVGQINPEPTIEASSVDSAIEEGVVAFDHHEPSALEALHTCPTLSNRQRKNYFDLPKMGTDRKPYMDSRVLQNGQEIRMPSRNERRDEAKLRVTHLHMIEASE